MRRIVSRVEGSQEYTCQLAIFILKNIFIDQGVVLRPMYVGNGKMSHKREQHLPLPRMIAENYLYTSFSHAQESIEEKVSKGINALLIDDSFLEWDCPGDRLNGPLELLEDYLMRHNVSVALLQDYPEGIPIEKIERVHGAMGLKRCSLDARDSYNENYCGAAFVLPYGVLPAFFIKHSREGLSSDRLDIRYLAPFHY